MQLKTKNTFEFHLNNMKLMFYLIKAFLIGYALKKSIGSIYAKIFLNM